MMSNPWEDVDGVADRQPAYCPYCGHEGAFDGQGAYGDTYLHRCGRCDQQFATVDPRHRPVTPSVATNGIFSERTTKIRTVDV